MKIKYEIKDTYEEALEFADKSKRPMSILAGDGGKFWVADLFNASKLIKQGYKIAREPNNDENYIKRAERSEAIARENAILNFIKETTKSKGYPPTIREIRDAVGLKSTSTIHDYINRLKEKGLISNLPEMPRTIKIENDEIDDSVLSIKDKDFYTFNLKGSSATTLKIYCERNNVDMDIAIEKAIQLLGLTKR